MITYKLSQVCYERALRVLAGWWTLGDSLLSHERVVKVQVDLKRMGELVDLVAIDLATIRRKHE